MSIEVKLFATLRKGRGKRIRIEYQDDLTPQKIFDQLNINKDDVAILLINGRNKEPDDEISNGDVLAIFPPVGGG